MPSVQGPVAPQQVLDPGTPERVQALGIWGSGITVFEPLSGEVSCTTVGRWILVIVVSESCVTSVRSTDRICSILDCIPLNLSVRADGLQKDTLNPQA